VNLVHETHEIRPVCPEDSASVGWTSGGGRDKLIGLGQEQI
jgi:hypothetical protein